MTALLDCPHGFAKRTQCFDCMEDGAIETPDPWVSVGSRFAAQFDSHCQGCDRTILAGQLICRWDRGADVSTYVHERCCP